MHSNQSIVAAFTEVNKVKLHQRMTECQVERGRAPSLKNLEQQLQLNSEGFAEIVESGVLLVSD